MGWPFAVDDGEAALQGDVVALEARDRWRRVQRADRGWVSASGMSERSTAMESASERALARCTGRARAAMLLASSRICGDGLREPALDGAVHQQVAEGEHEDERDERDEHRSPQHAGAQAGAEDAAALVGVELEDVADQQDQDADEEQEGDGRERDEDERLRGATRG